MCTVDDRYDFYSLYRLELSKKRLNCLSFESVKNVSLILMDNWMDEDDWDREFLASLKDLKVFLDRDKEHRNVVCSRLKEIPELVSPRNLGEIEMGFKVLTRNMLSIGLGSKDLKDFFVVLIEKIVEPLKQQMMLERSEVEQFLKAYTESVTDNVFQVDEVAKNTLEKYIATLGPCILAVYS